MGVIALATACAEPSYARGAISTAPRTIFRNCNGQSLTASAAGRPVFTGLEHRCRSPPRSRVRRRNRPALSFERLKELALDHLGSSPVDVAIFV
jgi:hypothetical protein